MTPAERATRIVEVARANPGASLADLAYACGRSERWTQSPAGSGHHAPRGGTCRLCKARNPLLHPIREESRS